MVAQILEIFFIIANLLRLTIQSEYLVSEEFTKKNFLVAETSSWTIQRVTPCQSDTDFVDFAGVTFMGILGLQERQTRTYSLPPHWSLSVRFDMLIYASYDAPDYNEVLIDNVSYGKYTKLPNEGYQFCETAFADVLNLYSKNITHSANSVSITIFTFTDEVITNEGTGIRNFYLYVDECHISCLTCNGPSETQCLTCPTYSTQSGSKCTCNSGYNLNSHACSITCPTGTIKSKDGSFCINNPCLNCASCDTTNQKCTICNSGYYVYLGYCVTSCPLTAPLSGNICVDFSSSLTNGKYLINGLSSNNFGQSEIFGMGLTITGFKGYNLNPSGALTTNCGTVHLLGGAYLSAASTISGLWSSIAPHWSIRIGFTLYKIDSWDNDSMLFKVDGGLNKNFTYVFTQGTTNMCGMQWVDSFESYTTNFTHTASTLKLEFINQLDQNEYDESYGMRDLYVLIDYCTSNCATCNASGCLTCNSGYFLYQKRCFSPCPSNTFISGTNCIDCDSTCATCTAATASSCTSCLSPYFKNGSVCQTTCPTSYWPDTTSRNCSICDNTCYTCQSPGTSTSCLSCSNTLYLDSNQCLANCPQTYQYKSTVTNNNKCLYCDATCKTCYGGTASNCLSCTLPRYYQSSTKSCDTNCLSNQYKDDTLVKCVNCNSNCQTCSGSLNNNCLSCLIGGSLFFDQVNKTCVSVCPDGTYKNTLTNVCSICDPICKTCNGPANNQCLSCTLPKYYQSSTKQCTDTCQTYQYKNDSVPSCDNCDSTCATCFGALPTQCLSCSGLLYFKSNQCLSNCGIGFFKDANNQCSICNLSCTTCSGPLDINCLSCQGNLFLNQSLNKCVTVCPDGTFNDISNNKCTLCNPNCLTCSAASSSSCLSCTLPKYYQASLNQCVVNCDSNQYGENTNATCSSCESSCKTCNGTNNTDCLSCSLPLYYQLATKQCISQCNSNQYAATTPSPSCESCDSTCSTCSGNLNKDCITCAPPLYLLNNRCIAQCPDGYFNNKSNNQCNLCYSTCKTCENENDCLTCEIPRYFQQSSLSCLTSCNIDQYKDDSSASCKSCDSTCASCSGSNSNECLTCSGTLYLDSLINTCVNVCPDGYYASSVDNTCQKCDASCLTCTDQYNNSCKSCQLPLYFQKEQNSCVTDCNQNQFKDSINVLCGECHSTCLTCIGQSDTQCSSCPSQSYFYNINQSCISNCPDGYFNDNSNNKCTICDSSCFTCKQEKDSDCLSCQSQRFLQLSTSTCQLDCQSNQYKNTLKQLCDSCHATCSTCSGPDDNQCLACSNQRFLYNGSCIEQCPGGLFNNSQNNQCSLCESSCKLCTDSTNLTCTACQIPSILFKNQCLAQCPDNYYLHQDTYQCNDCHKSCDTCNGSSKKQCLSCRQGYDLVKGLCLKQCDNGYYLDQEQNECNQCDASCLTCFGQSNDKCIVCSDSYMVYLQLCLSECPSNTYVDKQNQNQCLKCNPYCNERCNGPEKEDCDSIQPQNQIIVYILCAKSLLWIATVLYGFFKGSQPQNSFNQKILSSVSQTQNQQDLTDSPQRFKKEQNSPNLNGEDEDRVSPDILPVQQFNFDPNDVSPNTRRSIINPESTVTFSNTMEASPKRIRRKRTAKLDFMQSSVGVSVNKSIIKVTPVTSMNTARSSTLVLDVQQPQTSTLLSGLQQINLKEEAPNKGVKSSLQTNEKLKYSILGNEWLSLFKNEDYNVNRANRSTIIYLKYQMFFLLSEIFSLDPVYFVLACLGAGVVAKLLISLFIHITHKYVRHGNIITGIALFSLVFLDLYFWFIPTLMNLTYKKDLNWSFRYSLTFLIDFFVLQQVFGLIQYLSTIRYLNLNKINKKVHPFNNYLKCQYLLNKFKN